MFCTLSLLHSTLPPSPPSSLSLNTRKIPMVGHWSDLYGRRPFMAAPQLASLGSLGVVLLHLRTGLPLYWYYVVQVCMSGFSALAVNLAFLADTLSPVNRPPAFGLVLAVFSAAVILGPTLGSHLGADLAVKAAMVVVLLCSISTLTLLPESLPKEVGGVVGSVQCRGVKRGDCDCLAVAERASGAWP